MVIETYLHRRLDLDPMVRVNTAIRVSELVERKTGLKRQPEQSDDDFLETIARETRDQARYRSAKARRPQLRARRGIAASKLLIAVACKAGVHVADNPGYL